MPLEPLIAGCSCLTQGRSFNQHPQPPINVQIKVCVKHQKRGCARGNLYQLEFTPQAFLTVSAWKTALDRAIRACFDVKTPWLFCKLVSPLADWPYTKQNLGSRAESTAHAIPVDIRQRYENEHSFTTYERRFVDQAIRGRAISRYSWTGTYTLALPSAHCLLEQWHEL